MEGPRANLSSISVHLSRVLDEIGLNELVVKARKDSTLYQEQIESAHCEHLLLTKVFYLGSQSEGTTTSGLRSDLDKVYCLKWFNVIQDTADFSEGPINLLMLRENTAPGYCRLQLLKQNTSVFKETLPSQTYIYDEFNRTLLKNSFHEYHFPEIFDEQTNKNGPARTQYFPSYTNIDHTIAFVCTSRLDATEEWAGRKRPGGWPDARLIKQVVNEDIFLVPVGYKLSPTKDIEWRISTSLAERCLMFNLNIVQIKCFVILKMFVKTHVKPAVGKVISSYHCKTALLYCIENHKAGFWRDDNLIQCITRCLKMLLAWVKVEFCPHFIIAEANLFAGKVTSENKGKVQNVLSKLIKDSVEYLLLVKFDGIGDMLKIKLGTKPNRTPILDSIVTIKLLGYIEYQRNRIKDTSYCVSVNQMNQSDVIPLTFMAIHALKCTNFPYQAQNEATKQVIGLMSSYVGSQLASGSLGRNERAPQKALDLLDAAAESSISLMMKQASVFYCSGHLEKVEQICKSISDQFEQHLVYPVCFCYQCPDKFSSEQYQLMYTRRREVRYALCVTFTQHEIHCVPQALRHELFRAMGDDIHKRKIYDNWMVLAVVDCRPLLFYLQYMTYRDLWKNDLRKQSLHNLERCIIEESLIMNHVETAWNILGQCYEMENQPVAALHCYRKSLEIRPRNNAANWISFYRSTRG